MWQNEVELLRDSEPEGELFLSPLSCLATPLSSEPPTSLPPLRPIIPSILPLLAPPVLPEVELALPPPDLPRYASVTTIRGADSRGIASLGSAFSLGHFAGAVISPEIPCVSVTTADR
jgi:hypothetical protein